MIDLIQTALIIVLFIWNLVIVSSASRNDQVLAEQIRRIRARLPR